MEIKMAGVISFFVESYEAISSYPFDYHLGLKCLILSLLFDRGFPEGYFKITKSEKIYKHNSRCKVRQLRLQGFNHSVWKVIKQFPPPL